MEAKKLKRWSHLYTKDGRKIGNAKVVSTHMFFPKSVGLIPIPPFRVYKIKTDFGNTAELSLHEINTLFYLTRN